MTGATVDAWLGIDLGTQSVRALAVTGDGTILATASAPLSSSRDGNRHEQDPEHWWQATTAAIRHVLASTDTVIRGISVDGTSGTILLADATGTPLTQGLMYDDGRAADVLPHVNEAGHDLWTRLGYRRMQATWALPKLAWLQANHPDIVRAPGTRLMHQSDFINSRLAGQLIASDLSSALKTGADLINETWEATVVEALSIPPQILPPLVRSGTHLAVVGPDAAEQTGLTRGTPIVAGATDGCAAQLGAGALTPGDWNSVVGTTLVLKGVSASIIEDPLGVVYSHKGPDGQWLPGGASSSGAGVISRDFPDGDLARLERAARAFHPGATTTYPLVSNGERFPFNAPEAQGFTLGKPTSEAERYAAVLQGLAFVERLCFDYLDYLGADTSGRLLLTGGATKSAYWSQLRADVLGRDVHLPENAEPALGAAVLAAAGTSGRPTAEIADRMVRVSTTITPRSDYIDRFGAPYLSFLASLRDRGWLQNDVAAHARRNL
ncbi:sugar (pentulose or hexulose) kinase [Arthrobacter sp. CAN_A6]|uniref:FGGY-family carbohydrate kinase n=1 Tax=Arthrobacter sp. CAN_A6 TaxID=2787721 RepID=UPI0018CB66D3